MHFKPTHEKGVGTPFPRVPAPLHPGEHQARNQLGTPGRAKSFLRGPNF